MKISVRGRFILTSMSGIIVVCVIVLFTSYLTASGNFKKLLADENSQEAKDLSVLLEQWYAHYKTEGNIYSRVDPIARADVAGSVAYLNAESAAQLKDDPTLNNITFVDAQGTGHYGDGTTVDLSDRDYVHTAMQNQFVLSDPIMSKTTGKPIVVFAYPLGGDGQTAKAVLGVSVKLDGLFDILKEYDTPTNTLFVVDRNGTIIIHEDPSLIMTVNVTKADTTDPKAKADQVTKGLNAIGAKMVAGETGTGEYVIGGVAKLVSYHPVAGTGWSFGYAETKASIDARVWSQLRSELLGVIIAILIVFALSFPIVLAITRNFKAFRDELDHVMGRTDIKGDLTQRIRVKGSDELAQMAGFFNRFLEDVESILRSVTQHTRTLSERGQDLATNMEETSSAVIQINSNLNSIESQMEQHAQSVRETGEAVALIGSHVDNLSTQVESQSGSVSQASVAIEEMIANLQSITANITRLGEVIQTLSRMSDSGKTKLNATIQTIREVVAKSEGLEATNRVINDIAAQTNLLAMNAAIEAAHAGASGRGFAVVAMEIRKLAELAAGQSREIREILGSMKEAIQQIVENAGETEQTFGSILEYVRNVSGMEQEVRQSLMEQNAGSAQILDSLSNMKSLTQTVRLGSGEMKNQGKLVRERMETLQRFAHALETGMREIAMGTKEINDAIGNVDGLAQANKLAIGEVQIALGQLKISE